MFLCKMSVMARIDLVCLCEVKLEKSDCSVFVLLMANLSEIQFRPRSPVESAQKGNRTVRADKAAW